MTIWLYTVVRDEAHLVPWFLQHYGPIVDRMLVYDAGSVDGTPDLFRAGGAEVRPFLGPDGIDDLWLASWASVQYREARGQADWVLWPDVDELIVPAGGAGDLRVTLAALQAMGVTLPRTAGYQMLARRYPADTTQPLTALVREGIPDDNYSKPVVLQPSVDLQWSVGKHLYYPQGRVTRTAEPALWLLHYRYLGLSYVVERHARNMGRTSERNRQANLGQYPATGMYSPVWFTNEALPNAQQVLP